MAKQKREGRAIQVYLDEALYERLAHLALGNFRSISAEVRRALVRHLEAPEALTAPPRRLAEPNYRSVAGELRQREKAKRARAAGR
jgi:hypothetical protein